LSLKPITISLLLAMMPTLALSQALNTPIRPVALWILMLTRRSHAIMIPNEHHHVKSFVYISIKRSTNRSETTIWNNVMIGQDLSHRLVRSSQYENMKNHRYL
jgi:Mn2+/Fe2+ NRAMP family transporter